MRYASFLRRRESSVIILKSSSMSSLFGLDARLHGHDGRCVSVYAQNFMNLQTEFPLWMFQAIINGGLGVICACFSKGL